MGLIIYAIHLHRTVYKTLPDCLCANRLCKISYIPFLFIKIIKLVERMGEVRQSSYCIGWDKLISMFLHLGSMIGDEVVLQCIRCFLSFEWFASVDIVLRAAMEVACIASDCTVHGKFSNLPHKIVYRESFPIICMSL